MKQAKKRNPIERIRKESYADAYFLAMDNYLLALNKLHKTIKRALIESKGE